jgi:hypothetical protein
LHLIPGTLTFKNMNYQSIAEEIIKMKDNDLKVRQRLLESGELFEGYHREMEQVHIKNAFRLKEIIDLAGFPSKNKVGQIAGDAAMIIIQHAISLPDFQKQCLQYLKEVIDNGEDEKRNYAFLYDRICFNERQPQKFGTQYDWDKEGKMSPWKMENPGMVNQLRREYGLNSIEEETGAVRKSLSGEKPPEDFEQRQREILEWSKKTGWIK